MNIIFFGTSEIAVPILDKLLEQHTIAAVITSPDKAVGRKQLLTPSPIANLAARRNLLTYKPLQVKGNSELHRTLRQHQADIFIVVSYGKILPPELLDIPPLKTINVHFSLLPKYRGPAPVQFALLNGETTTGTTIFILDELVDHGPVLASRKLDIDPNDTNVTLQSKLAQLSSDLLLDILPSYESGKLTPTVQDHKLATSTKIITKEDGRIDWHDDAAQIYNKWRAFQPWPGIYTEWEGKTLKILECEPVHESLALPIGHTQADLVGCGQNTTLRLLTVQLEGRNPVAIKDFLNGYPDFAEATLQ